MLDGHSPTVQGPRSTGADLFGRAVRSLHPQEGQQNYGKEILQEVHTTGATRLPRHK